MQKVNKRRPRPLAGVDAFFSFFTVFGVVDRALFWGLLCVLAREQRARMDVDEPTARAVGGEILPMIFVVSKAIEYIKNQILDRVVSHRRLLDVYVVYKSSRADGKWCALRAVVVNEMLSLLRTRMGLLRVS